MRKRAQQGWAWAIVSGAPHLDCAGMASVAKSSRRVADTHREVFGAAPEGVWSAPGRVNLIGEHTDYNDGLCCPSRSPTARMRPRPRDDDLLRLGRRRADRRGRSARPTSAGHSRGWAAYVAGVAVGAARGGAPRPGLEVAVDGRVPVGAGLSSLRRAGVPVAVALDDLFGLGLPGDDAGRAAGALCVRAENDVAGAPTGGMDQAASLRAGRPRAAARLPGRPRRHVPFDLGGATDGLGCSCSTPGPSTRLVDGQYAAAAASARRPRPSWRRACATSTRPLDERSTRSDEVLRRRARHVVTEIARVGASRPARRRPAAVGRAVRRLARLAARRLRGVLRRARPGGRAARRQARSAPG